MESNYTTPMSYTDKLIWLCTLAADCLKDNNNRFPSAQTVLVDSAKELQRLAEVEKKYEALLKKIEEENDTYPGRALVISTPKGYDYFFD